MSEAWVGSSGHRPSLTRLPVVLVTDIMSNKSVATLSLVNDMLEGMKVCVERNSVSDTLQWITCVAFSCVAYACVCVSVCRVRRTMLLPPPTC